MFIVLYSARREKNTSFPIVVFEMMFYPISLTFVIIECVAFNTSCAHSSTVIDPDVSCIIKFPNFCCCSTR